ncbi:MAG: DUF4271 domain-containing protein [Paludibacteraceae bacterium]|nr:DUF4271 domain-containing protein [Paludibacteraceae bacterium]
MAEIEHIISPLSAPWCAWTMLVLLLIAILSEWLQPGVITQAALSLVARTDRTYKEAPANTFGQLFIALFRIGTLALGLCLCLATDGQFSFVGFSVVCGLILGMLLLKMLCNQLLDYTFLLTRRAVAPYEHYANIATLATLVLYPAILILMHVGTPVAGRWVVGIVTILFIGMWLYRSFRLFVTSVRDLLYLMLYVATLEILPLAALYYLSEKLVSVI